MMKQLLPFTFLIASTAVLAQPTHNFPLDTDLYGQGINFIQTGMVEEGPAGANQIWNFGDYTGQTLAGSLEDPSTTPYAEMYPEADMVGIFPDALGTQYYFYDHQSDGVYTRGFEIDGLVSQVYYEPRQDLASPLSIETTWSDSSYFASNSFGFVTEGASNFVAEVDGYGTLITPDGTYENVLRIHTVETIELILDVGIGPPQISESVIESYGWVIDGFPIPILLTFDQTTDGEPSDGGSRMVSGLTTFTTEANTLEGVSLYPVPAIDFVTLDLGNNEIGNAEVRLFDVKGSLLKSFRQNPGRSQIRINVSDLPAGFYSVQIRAEEGVATKHFTK